MHLFRIVNLQAYHKYHIIPVLFAYELTHNRLVKMLWQGISHIGQGTTLHEPTDTKKMWHAFFGCAYTMK